MILPRQYLDVAWAISWEGGLLMALMPNQFKDMIHFDSLYLVKQSFKLWDLHVKARLIVE